MPLVTRHAHVSSPLHPLDNCRLQILTEALERLSSRPSAWPLISANPKFRLTVAHNLWQSYSKEPLAQRQAAGDKAEL